LLLAAAGFGLLSVGDSFAKSMAGQWPGTAIGTVRYMAGAFGLCMLLAIKKGRAGFVMPTPFLHVARGASVALGSACFFVGLHFMPMAEATVISFTSPMITALLSALVLKEPAPKAAYVATLLAFVGVVIVVRPSFAHLGAAALLPLCTAILMAILMILNRKVAGTAGLITMQFLISVMAVPFLILFTILGHFSGVDALAVTVPDRSVIFKCIVMAFTASTAHALIFAATERASAALIAPMTYIQLMTAVSIGVVAFGDIPEEMTAFGAIFIVGSGIYLWNSQRAR
jgi:drug/metabolite transporter (DMT)-like permease